MEYREVQSRTIDRLTHICLGEWECGTGTWDEPVSFLQSGFNTTVAMWLVRRRCQYLLKRSPNL
jgi:hypothetical protein